MTFVGLDLHKRYVTACALEARGAGIAESRQLATTIETVLDWLAVLPQPVVIPMEATLYWEWLVARLPEAGHTAHGADAYQVKLIWQARSKRTASMRASSQNCCTIPPTISRLFTTAARCAVGS